MKSLTLAFSTLVLLVVPAVADDPSEADQALIEAVQAAGGQAMQLAKNDARLTIAFHLSDKDITDETLDVFAEAGNVYSINLRGTKVTDAGLQKLAGLKSLTRLHLEKTEVTDAGLAHISGLENLEYLNVYGTKITDDGLEHIKGLGNLRKLFVWQTGVTMEGEEPLKAALPDLEIVPDFKKEKERAYIAAQRAYEDA
ncbi:MAG: hypothetical protein ABGZ35_00635, partial [Planctomycetaceae bacterium]